MTDFEFYNTIPRFTTVGTLRALLKNYPDDTPVTVCGTPGLFYLNNEQQYILLETMDSSGYEALADTEPTIVEQEYMDF